MTIAHPLCSAESHLRFAEGGTEEHSGLDAPTVSPQRSAGLEISYYIRRKPYCVLYTPAKDGDLNRVP